MDEFHFLRPLWLLVIIPAAVLVWYLLRGRGQRGGWQQVVDQRLQRYVLADSEMLGERRWPVMLGLVTVILAAVALAGPTWERLPVPAFRSDEALVVAVDLSRSMDAGDLEPSRLARAKIKLLSLLERRPAGQTALVVFSAHAFTVTPLTTDTRTIASLVGALTTDIMPSQGSFPEAGLTKAGSLLRQTGMTSGEILLITDAAVSAQSIEVARDLWRDGFRIHVLAAGTEEGAPIPKLEGGFLTDDAGQVVVPRLDSSGLQRLASAGGGRFAQLAATDRDLDALFPADGVGVIDTDSADEEYEADVWLDQGIWLALLLVPILLLAFRRGWVYIVVAAFLLPVPDSQAFTWSDLWLRPDQKGARAFENDDPVTAANLFDDPEWRAAASYEAGDYPGSASSLTGIDTVEAHYNRGNALAKSGQLEPAIQAYDRALELEPDHADALYNRELVSELLEQQQQQNEQQQQSEEESGEQQSQAAADQSEQGEQGQQQEQSESSPSASEQQADASDSEQESQPTDVEQEQADAEPQNDEPQPGDEQQNLQASVLPEDIEEWASEQAADQWLRRIPQDPGGLLRRKFLYQYQRLGVDQDGNYVWPGDEAEPW